jgi:hypothetical protein
MREGYQRGYRAGLVLPFVLAVVISVCGPAFSLEKTERLIRDPDIRMMVITECPSDLTVGCEACTDPSCCGWPDTGGGVPPVDTAYYDVMIDGACPESYEIRRTFRITGADGSVDSCFQTISVADTLPPDVTCPEDLVLECDAARDFGAASASDNCDPDPIVTYLDEPIPGPCVGARTIVRTWRAEDHCGNPQPCSGQNSFGCEQRIKIVDTTPPTITCPPDLVVECGEPIDYGVAVAVDNCDPNPVVIYMDEMVPGPCPGTMIIIRTWQAEDDCGNPGRCNCSNSFGCEQKIRIRDRTPPVITCPADTTVPCGTHWEFSLPQAQDLCDPDPEIAVAGTDTIFGDLEGEMDITRCWTATDACGKTATCCRTVTIGPCEGDSTCSFTQGGWGSTCPPGQQGNPQSTQPGCIRDNYLGEVFPTGLTIGLDGEGLDSATWTDAQAVEQFLPTGGPVGPLGEDLVDPVDTPAGVLAGQILALKINVGLSCDSVFLDLGMTESSSCLGDYVIPEECPGDDPADSCSRFAGLTVAEFLDVADQALAGDSTVLEPYKAGYLDLNCTATWVNEHYGCEEDDPVPCLDVAEEDRDDDIGDPERLVPDRPDQAKIRAIFPNPLSGSTTIEYELPVSGKLTVDIYDIQGRKVMGLVGRYQDAGRYGVVWNGRDNAGRPVVSGVYFCRLKLGEQAGVLEKMIKL